MRHQDSPRGRGRSSSDAARNLERPRPRGLFSWQNRHALKAVLRSKAKTPEPTFGEPHMAQHRFRMPNADTSVVWAAAKAGLDAWRVAGPVPGDTGTHIEPVEGTHHATAQFRF